MTACTSSKGHADVAMGDRQANHRHQLVRPREWLRAAPGDRRGLVSVGAAQRPGERSSTSCYFFLIPSARQYVSENLYDRLTSMAPTIATFRCSAP
jgi:hypothetical protein